MRNLFPSYYGLTDEQYSELWQECIISFDTNVLLNIYRYTPQTRERFFEILRRLGDRIWITHQAAQEYQDDRLTVISSVQLNAYRHSSRDID